MYTYKYSQINNLNCTFPSSCFCSCSSLPEELCFSQFIVFKFWLQWHHIYEDFPFSRTISQVITFHLWRLPYHCSRFPKDIYFALHHTVRFCLSFPHQVVNSSRTICLLSFDLHCCQVHIFPCCRY